MTSIYFSVLTDRRHPRFLLFVLALIGSFILIYDKVGREPGSIVGDYDFLWLPGVFLCWLLAFISAHRYILQSRCHIKLREHGFVRIFRIALAVGLVLYFLGNFYHWELYTWFVGVVSAMLLIYGFWPLGGLQFTIDGKSLLLFYKGVEKELFRLQSWEYNAEVGTLMLKTGERTLVLEEIDASPESMEKAAALLEDFRRKTH